MYKPKVVAGLRDDGGARESVVFRALYFLFYGSGAAWFPYFNVYLRDLGLTGAEIGLIAVARTTSMLVAQPAWAVGADSWGRRRMLVLAMPLAAVLVLGYAFGSTFVFFVVWTLVYTATANPVGTLIDSLVLDHLEAHRQRTFGSLRLWGAVGWGITAPLVGLAIAGRDQRLMLIFAAALMLIGWILVLRGATESGAAPPAARRWSGAAQVVRNRSLLIFLALVALLQVGAASIFSFYSVYMSEIGASSRLIGLAYSLQGFSELPLYLGAAVILQRLGTAGTLAVAYLAFAARCLLYATIREPALAALVELSHGLSFSLFLVASVDYVNRLVPSEWRATGQSLLVMAYFGLGSILGNAWTGVLYDRYGVQQMFLINGLWILGVAALTLLVLRRSGRAEAPMP